MPAAYPMDFRREAVELLRRSGTTARSSPPSITFFVHPDPVSGMHCWHQKVRAIPAPPGDRYGDIVVDLSRSREVYRRWLSLARPAHGELRRPLWLYRQVKPTREAYRLPQDGETRTARAADGRWPSPLEMAALVDWSPPTV